MQFPHDTNRRTLKNRRISTIRFQHLKYTQGNCMRNYGAGGAWPRHPRITGPGRGAGFGRLVGPARVGGATAQTNFAHNFPRSLFETARKRCNSNDANSTFEQAAGELRAKLLWRGPLHPLRGATPVMGRDTRSEGVHCLRIGCSTPSHKNKRGSCETRTWVRYRSVAAGLDCGARGRWRGLAAVPVGGGGAWLRCRWVAAGPGCGARGR